MKPSIMLWCGDFPDQCALANKLSREFILKGIVIERRKSMPFYKHSIKKLLTRLAEKILTRKLDIAWFSMLSHFANKYHDYPPVPTLITGNINNKETISFFNEHRPDLVLVSGTRLIREKLLDLKPAYGIINLHTGLSPYVNGGPNCTNWCLSNNQFHLIGNTVMWIDEGIDSGNLIATETTDFTGNETLTDVYIRVADHAHTLYINSVKSLLNSKEISRGVPQSSVTTGRTFYNRMWSLRKKLKALKNFRKFSDVISSEEYKLQKSGITTIEYEDGVRR